ncbi:unnamed protein product [Leptidea sinapis]|uniref:Uncharacterized protein n=1 Tax=Leptidea sinapis TaxID=189913 RepID=A0A5E4QVC4_9NEOP|nr:unnamed protein product [Leptidea sinapis]
MEITFIEVQVNALSPPKVDYEESTSKLNIRYSWAQLAMSTYSIVVKAKPVGDGRIQYY